MCAATPVRIRVMVVVLETPQTSVLFGEWWRLRQMSLVMTTPLGSQPATTSARAEAAWSTLHDAGSACSTGGCRAVRSGGPVSTVGTEVNRGYGDAAGRYRRVGRDGGEPATIGKRGHRRGGTPGDGVGDGVGCPSPAPLRVVATSHRRSPLLRGRHSRRLGQHGAGGGGEHIDPAQ